VRIGPHDLGPWILAPMAGVSELPYRLIVRELGASAAPTELVSAKGLLHGSARTARYLAHDERERPFWVQLFGGEPESMAAGAERAVALGADIIDINMGCPVKKVTRGGAGAALMVDPERAAGIVRLVLERTGVPVTAKIRSGWDDGSLRYLELGAALVEAGVSAIAIHARTRAQGYSGRADWSHIARLAAAVAVPVIGNGDASTPELARRMLAETGCAAVMIGRGALGNPWIFAQLARPSFEGPAAFERWQLVRRHLHAHLAFVGDETCGIRRFRPHLLWYSRGLHGAADFRRRATSLDALASLLGECEAFFLRAERSPEAEELELSHEQALG
jgi:nifR3 family TIM-barrel protein